MTNRDCGICNGVGFWRSLHDPDDVTYCECDTETRNEGMD